MQYIDGLLPDILCYCILAILSIIALFMKESIGKTYTVFPLTITVTSIVILIVCDLFVPLYHAAYAILLRPAYTSHLIIACYVFLPISDNFQAFIFGLSVTLCHLFTLGFVTYNKIEDKSIYLRLGSDAIYLACINSLGLYFRFVNEILKRRTFLDRRACVESTLKLKYEKEQEEQLMESILPQHITRRVRDDIMRTLEQSETKLRYKPSKNLYIEKHDNVTILFADIVNYTEMTRLLPVKTLVETLNELFGKFDDASENHDVLRIKFLGDCYYCVSGLPDPNPDHAVCCVELGLDMIDIIQKVRAKRNLNINLNMRIGVHSGNLYSGLIGECKWQYDIWSSDVLIANHMEQSGQAGKVHVTKQTLDLLRDKYQWTKSDCQETDTFLQKLNIEGYLISPTEDPTLRSRRSEPVIGIYDRRVSVNPGRSYVRARHPSIHPETTSSALSHRRTAFMDNRVKKLQNQLKEIENNLEEAIEKLPIRKFEQWFRSPGINPLFLTFRNLKMEFPYLVKPDPLFKYYLLSSVFVLLAIFIIQNLTIPIWNWGVWLVFGTLGLLVCIFIPISWLYTIYKKFFSNNVFQQQNCFIQFIKYTAGLVNTSVSLRIILYLTVSLLIAACTILDLSDCDHYLKKQNSTLNNNNEEERQYYCLNPWHMSQTCCLAVIASFLFLRIHLGLKFLIGTAITYLFAHYTWSFEVFFDGETWNPFIRPQIACIMSLTFLTFTLHLIDRQAEYLRRLDFQWQIQLTQEQSEAQKTHKINSMLLSNILPIHVVEVYLNSNIPADEPYSEEYGSVAVMFASVIIPIDFGGTNDIEKIGDIGDPEETLLIVMNKIISEFDMLLTKPCGQKVEKIKLAKWTYMAACGLDPGRKDSNASMNKLGRDNIVVQMVRFALNMMRVLSLMSSIDTCQNEFKLRIGISHGEVTAGVVGSKKPLYDIWGDTVNTASRMDTTGEDGKIQVTEHTAKVLQKQGIQCTYRAMTFVKGIGDIPTYYVDLEDQQSIQILDNNIVR